MVASFQVFNKNYTGIMPYEQPSSSSTTVQNTDVEKDELMRFAFTNPRQDLSQQVISTTEHTIETKDTGKSSVMRAASEKPNSDMTASNAIDVVDPPRSRPVLRSVQINRTIIKDEEETRYILRSHFVKPILADLRNIQETCGTPLMAMYAGKLLRIMRAMRDLSPSDPYVDVVLALHDAMAYQNHWAEYTAEQYAGVCEVLKKLVRRQNLRPIVVRKAIMELEYLGFDTTPFEIPNYEEC